MKYITNLFNSLQKQKILKYIGPGLLVAVGFIDPGNWAANIAGGSQFGYNLLWVITAGTIVLIILQHNVAHLGIITGRCLAEEIYSRFNRKISLFVLGSALLANVSVILAEILGVTIALNMLFNLDTKIGAIIAGVFSFLMVITNRYKKIEKIIIGFIAIIGFSFIFELSLVDVSFEKSIFYSFVPNLPKNSHLIAMSMFGAIVMPHNLFLHSEIIQSRQWNTKDESVIKKQLQFEFIDTIFAMGLGWIINAAMVLLSVSCFFYKNTIVTELPQAHQLLIPLLGNKAALIFAIALFLAGFSSSMTAIMAAGTTSAGMFGEEYNVKSNKTLLGAFLCTFFAVVIIFFVKDIFKALIFSQAILCFQIPFTIASQLYLTSNKKIMGKYANSKFTNILIALIGIIITFFNIYLLFLS
ncbi:Nramp family divalent metal transporter [uncultured Cetobacterium sp.]|uniref:Nramp family divalent metal transporter n=1 Tax=uncultured Cetobacterium sp. TaxID=527638 RepID=UPI0025CD1E19|nr:Nramp family divalent metal transporter [uncultured Cetobacterium sp.]